MSWPITALESGERYATVQDLVAAEQLSRMPVKVIGATFSDGTPLKVVVRALTAKEQAACLRKARDTHGAVDEWTFAVEAVWRGMDEPRLTESQKAILWDMNGAIIHELADIIERLSNLPAYHVRQEVERLAHVAIPDAPQTDADHDPTPGTARVVSDDPGAPVESADRGT
ncbi:MAG: hypothetical protein MI924_10710 [Chloroflexales bacterium]|nr:hypothetical protein [Chloroflexales bacterium]